VICSCLLHQVSVGILFMNIGSFLIPSVTAFTRRACSICAIFKDQLSEVALLLGRFQPY
jgi:hypothetical protein